MRMYEPIWLSIKKNGVCIIACEKRSQPRVVKAVVKEKYNDGSYKAAVDGYLQIIREDSKVTFKLVKRIGIGDL